MGFSVRSAVFFPICMLIFFLSCDNLWEREHVFDKSDVEVAVGTVDFSDSEGEHEDLPLMKHDPSVETPIESLEVPSIEASPMSGAKESYIMETTAYNATVEQCGKADGITASGTYVTEGRTVACNDFPFGTKLLIGENVYVVEDRCGYDNVVDIYFDDHRDAMNWGRKTMEVTVVE